MRYALAAAVLVASPSLAHATMPMLAERPSPPTSQACQQWAAGQSDDAKEMWGTLESGKTSTDIGAQRLVLYCLGDTPPDIVYFYSSAGATRAYCKSRPNIPICREQR